MSLTPNTAPVVGDTSAMAPAAFIRHMQRAASSALDPLIARGARVALIDYPNNTNVGDSLIWLGEMAYLRSRGVEIVYHCDLANCDPAEMHRRLTPDTLILGHGGGNYGTIWPHEQQFREQIIKEFPDHRIIQLPQSLHFDNQEAIERTAKIVGAHGAYTVLTRDHVSQTIARDALGCDAVLCPDMAFFIGEVRPPAAPTADALVLARTDREKTDDWHVKALNNGLGLKVEVVDWLDPSISERAMHRIEMHSGGVRQRLDPANLALAVLWERLCERRLARGAELLGRGRTVITNRLHAHILSVLLGKPHAIIDNANGKVRTFYETWTRQCDAVSLVSGVEGALDHVARQLQAQAEEV